MREQFIEYKHNRAYKLISQFTLVSALPSRFPKYFLGLSQWRFCSGTCCALRADIGSNFDQFHQKLQKLSQLLEHIVVNRQSYDLI